jgi:hypothetical protein
MSRALKTHHVVGASTMALPDGRIVLVLETSDEVVRLELDAAAVVAVQKELGIVASTLRRAGKNPEK